MKDLIQHLASNVTLYQFIFYIYVTELSVGVCMAGTMRREFRKYFQKEEKLKGTIRIE